MKDGKTVVFFYISQNGAAVVRKSSDYIVDMIETAGALYITIILLTVIMHLDILEKIRDYFK